MNIINSTKELNSKEKYALTMSPKIEKMSGHKGEVINVSKWMVYEDTDKDGNSRTILSVMDQNGSVYATNSATFRSDFEKILEIVEDEDFSIEVIRGTSKAGREFITCALV